MAEISLFLWYALRGGRLLSQAISIQVGEEPSRIDGYRSFFFGNIGLN
ncbi:hypothetical protein CLV98_103396 [Dyadobacter jejuensis]|uniref:Uncharacterized protein n=1 Tax=Dyadobacter jejuensis TaxID=1082580 RepID=A0A316AMR6_9BACT|nr:hypothetical protein CLV98_103396 [Dyadobacter jejuensis]